MIKVPEFLHIVNSRLFGHLSQNKTVRVSLNYSKQLIFYMFITNFIKILGKAIRAGHFVSLALIDMSSTIRPIAELTDDMVDARAKMSRSKFLTPEGDAAHQTASSFMKFSTLTSIK